MNNEQPLVTVNILSYNRKDELRNTLTKVYDEDYKNIEVIVVDNASTDGSAEMVDKEFPEVKLIKMEKNIGIAGWNEGFKIAKGEFVLVLDDDSYPENGAVQKSINCIHEDAECGVVCYKINNINEKRVETHHINKINPNTFIGCGALIRKSTFEEAGYFNDLLFLYEHETEFSMRVYNRGLKLRFCEEAQVVHVGSVSNRLIKSQTDCRRKYFLCRNYVMILFLHFSLFRVLFFLPQLIFARLIMSMIEGNIFTSLNGFINGFMQIPKIIPLREPLKNEIQKFYNYGNYMGRFVKEKRY